MKKGILVMLSLMILFTVHGFGQTIKYVKSTATGPGDGSSWVNALPICSMPWPAPAPV